MVIRAADIRAVVAAGIPAVATTEAAAVAEAVERTANRPTLKKGPLH
jgi:hypothetical protein